MEELKIVRIGPKGYLTTRIKMTFSKDEEIKIAQQLRENTNLFA